VLNNIGTIAHEAGVLEMDIQVGQDVLAGTLNNGGLYDLQSDANIQKQFGVGAATFNNSGVFRKSAGVGTSSVIFSLPFNNRGGTIDIESGTFAIGVGTHTGGIFTAGAGAMLQFTGTHTFTGSYTGSGQGAVQLAGISFFFGAGGATFNFAGSLLQWKAGRIQAGTGTLTNTGTMTLVPGGADTILLGPINNAGTFIQSGVVALDLSGSAVFTNLPGAVFDFQGDGAMFQPPVGPLFVNRGTLRKSQGTYSAIHASGFNNVGGTIDVQSGLLGIGAGVNDGGTFTVAAGATLDLTDGAHNCCTGFVVTYEGSFSGSGAGTVLLAADVLAIDPSGATFNFPAGMFQWTGGAIASPIPAGSSTSGTLTNAGTITLSGTGTKFLDGVLANQGTILHQSGTLQLDFFRGGSGTLNNSGLYDMQGDVVIQRQFLIPVIFNNSGTLRKSAGAGTATGGALPLNNTGTVEIRSGTFAFASTSVIQQISGTALIGGTWNVFANSTLTLQSITCPGGGANCNLTTNQANITLNGLGATFSNISGLTGNAGSFNVLGGRAFTTGSSLTNTGSLTVGPASAINVNGTYTQTSAGSLSVQIDGRAANGRFGRLASTSNAVLDGTLNVALVNGFGPTAGDVYSILTFASHSGTFGTINGLNAGSVPLFRADLLPTSLTLTALAGGADLAVKTVDIVTATAKPGQNVSIGYTVNNLGGIAASGDWDDAVYLSATPFIDASAVLLGTVHHTGGLAASASYSQTLTAPLPALLPRGYRAIVTADSRKQVPDTDRANNTLASSATLVVTMPMLVLGTPLTDTIAVNQDSYYHLIVPPRSDVTLAAKYAIASQAELYVRFGALPDRTIFDLSTLGNVADPKPTLAFNSTQGGDYYILVHGLQAAGGGQSFTLTATNAQFAVTDFLPKTAFNGPNETIDVRGTGFSPSTTVSLVAASGTVYRPSIVLVSPNAVAATFDLSAVPLGSYSVRAEDGSKSATASSLFKVTDVVGVGNFSSMRIMTPGRVRVGSPIPMSVHIQGLPDSITPVPYVEVDASNIAKGQEKEQFVDPSLPDFIEPGGSLDFGFIYRPDPKGSGVISGFELELISLTQGMNWDAQKDPLRASGIPADAWDAIWANLRPRLGGIVGDFYALLKRDAIALSAIDITTNSINRLFAFELRMANDELPLPNLATATDAIFPAPGLPLNFGRTFLSSSLTGRFRLGRLGRGWIDSFDITAETDLKDGVVIISNGVTTRVFISQGGGTYKAFPGDSGSLAQTASGYLLQEIDGVQTAFRTDGTLDYLQDANRNRITAGYTGSQLTSLTHSDGSRMTLSYSPQGRLTQVTDPAGRIASYTYDSSGEELLSVTTPGGTVAYSYTPERSGPHAFALASITTPSGRHQFFDYDTQGRLKSQQLDGSAEALTYAYDVATIRVTDANNQSASISYDDLGRVVVTLDALGRVNASVFDEINRVRAIAVGSGIVTFVYDTQGYVTRMTDPLGATQTLAYKPTFHRLESFTDALGNSTTFTYDGSGNLISIAYPDGSTEQYSYDANGNRVRSIDRNGRATLYAYDSRGLQTSVQLADGSALSYAYDANGNLVSAADAKGTTLLQYDAADRLTRITYPTGHFLSYSYDADGRRTRLVDQTGFTVNYAYDGAGRLAALSDGAGGNIVQYAYDAAGQLTDANYGNGTSTHYDYDADGELLHIVNSGPGGAVNSRFDYTYDASRRRSTLTTLEGLATYGYDADNRLTSVTLPNGRSLAYDYDAAGNRLGVTDNGVPTAYVANDLDEYTAVGATTQSFDLAGNLTSSSGPAGNASYTYDALNRLVGVTNASGTWTYEYDALGNRVSSTHDSVRTEYLIDPAGFLGSVVAEYGGSGELLAHYAYGHGLVSRVDAANAASYYDFDAVGSTVGMTGGGGGYINRYAYLPFGEIAQRSETIPNPLLFSGGYGVRDDGSGLNHMRVRSYDPIQGRFTQPDPLGLAGGLNPYSYALDDPVRYADPSGLVTPPGYQGNKDWFNTGTNWESMRTGQSRGPGGTYRIDIDSYPRQLAERLSAERAAKAAAEQASKAAAEQAAKPFYLRPVGPAGTVAAGVVLSIEFFYIFDALVAAGQYAIFGDLPLCIGVPFEQRNLLCEYPTTTGSPGGHSDTVQADPSDPNFIAGPAGFGPNNFIAGDATIPYIIGFENKPSANAPAQQVVITETLDANLDLATFRLGDFGFGDTVLHIPEDEARQFYNTRIDASTSLGIYINVSAALNPQTRVVTWTFTSLDPHTLEPPIDIGVGFLPPDRTPPDGEGWVTYFVQPKSGLAQGTAVNAQASVVFDVNAPVATNVYTNLLDTAPPTSRVNALPSVETTTSFTVTWSGDDGAGPGIASFDVFVSQDGGAFAPFVAGTAATSAVFQGATGHTYGFYSLATDNLGIREAAKTSAEATTQVTSGTTCATDVSSQVLVTRSGFGYDFTTGRFLQTVTLKNSGTSVVTGPLSLVLDNLSSNATLFNLSGTTACALPAGSPFINLSGDFNAGASASVTLEFTNPSRAGITYATRVLAGSAGR
jgi:RHS repeat-associated protein